MKKKPEKFNSFPTFTGIICSRCKCSTPSRRPPVFPRRGADD